MGMILRIDGAHTYYNLPRGHQDVVHRILEANSEPCPDAIDGHDPDVVYSARLRVRDAFCLKCGQTLTIPPRVGPPTEEDRPDLAFHREEIG